MTNAAKKNPAKTAAPQPSQTPSAGQPETIVNDKLAPAPNQAGHQPSGPSEVLGDVVWLMTHSPTHKHLFLADLEWLVLPSVMNKQFRLFKSGNRPFAFVSWALLDEEAEKRLLAGQPRLRPGDWRAGDRLWLIDLVAPFGGADGVLKEVKQKLFADRKVMALRPNPDGKGVVAGEVELVDKAA
jgi:cytolysin-activating lysine-acyltransferase